MTSRIAVLATGGTIANTPHGRIGTDELIADVRRQSHELDAYVLDIRDLFRDGSDAFDTDHWIRLATAAQEAADDEAVAGLVVTHGTYSVEETSYFLHLAVRTNKAIVFAVSQRMHGTAGNDGDRNLIDAVRVAASPDAARLGAVVVVNAEIHSAREVRKASQRPGGFTSGSLGILGSVEQDRVSVYRRPTRRHTATSSFELPSSLPRVDIVSAYPGADAIPINSLVEAGSRGIVLAGFSYRGLPFPSQVPALDRAVASGVRIVCASRGLDGRVPVMPEQPYLSADNLAPTKARILLAIALANNPEAVTQEVFDNY